MNLSKGTSPRMLIRWHGMIDAEALRREALRRILDAAARAIQARGRFQIVLSGGQTPRPLYRMLRSQPADWSAWHIFLGDERGVPRESQERNSHLVAEEWLDHVPIPATQLHMIPAELGVRRAATAYAEELRRIGDFDLVTLGLGEDGHTASLFPGHDWGVTSDAPAVMAVFDAPKPPPERVSLSAARLSRALEVMFLVEGESKAAAIAQWRAGKLLPASAIRPVAGVDVLVTSALLAPPPDGRTKG
jgi:6-phosphogluconolactonase